MSKIERTNIYFGNLTISAFEKRIGIKFSEEHAKWLEEHRSNNVDHGNSKFHIFELPTLEIHCGTNIRNDVYNILVQYDYENCKEAFGLVEYIYEY